MGSASTGSSVTYTYCNVTVAYTHTGKGAKVVLLQVLPQPSDFKNRFYVADRGGFSLSSFIKGGLAYGAAGGATDAGYGVFSNSYDEVSLYGSRSINWDAAYMFGYQALGEMTELLDLDNLSDLDNLTYDILSSGGKLLHYHGESDLSIPAASSVHYWQSVQSIMYGNLTDDAAPGPYLQGNMDIMTIWVENGVKLARPNATVSSGSFAGETQMLRQWPTRPLRQGNSSSFDCVTDEASIDNWTYAFPDFKLPVY
ncbi:hypothetical protein F4818DRAFT_443221 [Hypoxylon cercidicola]|nr:hypothetical protein F4818DRAFT_443221 [Hypoxylon cercidicola]